MKKMPELKTKEEIAAFWGEHDSTKYVDWDKAKRIHFIKQPKNVKSLVCEISEAKRQIEAGEYISIYDAFDRVIAKYEE
ncbi:CopG family antitoxin [Sulfuricurvum sp.]|uniref:CopG family antitoxin n=1 Tax=Sulfuricurvum sp. TaxID=2025608 RepID=UPI003C44B404